jgi:hypothetical protein
MKNFNFSLLHQFTDSPCEISINSPEICSTYVFTDFFFTTMSDDKWLTLGDNENRDIWVKMYISEIVQIEELSGCDLVEIKLSDGSLIDICRLNGE